MLLATYEVTSEKRGEPGDRRSIGSSGPPDSRSSLERRGSSRRFSYGYLVTTSPQSPTIPWAPASLAGWRSDFRYSRLSWCDGRCVQGPGTYSPRRSDPRLLAIPTSRSRVAACNPNLDRVSGIG